MTMDEEARREPEARFISSAQEALLRDYVDRVLADVFQGKKEHLREHLTGLAAKVSREHPWPYFEERVAQAKAEALMAHREFVKRVYGGATSKDTILADLTIRAEVAAELVRTDASRMRPAAPSEDPR